ncbi:MAG: class D sortase [Acidobacteriota bacterium]
MKIRCRTNRLEPALRWTQRFLFAGAILMLGYCGFAYGDAWVFQHQAERQLVNLPTQEAGGGLPAPGLGSDGLIGRIEILRLGVSVAVVEGTGSRALRRAAGHIEGTALPGQAGNVGISAHRDTFFRPLRNIQRHDSITLATGRGEFHYRVVSTKVVSPEDVAVLNPDGNEILTLVTCYPFYFIGPAPSRFIVRAERVL